MIIPEKLQEIIKSKAIAMGVTEDEILEYIILEYVPSTLEEKKLQMKRRKQARDKFLSENFEHLLVSDTDRMLPPEKIWNHGFRTGWEQFQTRKSSPIFKRKQ